MLFKKKENQNSGEELNEDLENAGPEDEEDEEDEEESGNPPTPEFVTKKDFDDFKVTLVNELRQSAAPPSSKKTSDDDEDEDEDVVIQKSIANETWDPGQETQAEFMARITAKAMKMGRQLQEKKANKVKELVAESTESMLAIVRSASDGQPNPVWENIVNKMLSEMSDKDKIAIASDEKKLKGFMRVSQAFYHEHMLKEARSKKTSTGEPSLSSAPNTKSNMKVVSGKLTAVQQNALRIARQVSPDMTEERFLELCANPNELDV